MRKWSFVISAVLFFAIGGNVWAGDLSADEVVSRANIASYYAGQDGISDVKMTITDAQGRKRNREFRILRYNVAEGAEQKFFVYFYKPADVARMVYMVWKNMDRDDDRWLYLPALDLVRRIAASDNRSSFVGSHFVYEDVSGRGVTADIHEIIETTDRYYRVRNRPKNSQGVEFAYYDVWIRAEDFLPYQSEYYDSADNVIRKIEAVTIEEIQGKPTVVASVVTDFERGGQTMMEFSNVRYDVGLAENIFEERYLRRPPMEWMR